MDEHATATDGAARRPTPLDPYPEPRQEEGSGDEKSYPPEMGTDAIAILEGRTFMLSDASGNVPAGSTGGLLHHDTRFVSRWELTLDGQPLSGALITFEPEKFLGDEIKTAFATTNQFGTAAPSIPIEQRPDPKLPGGANFGLYKVRISKIVNGKETIPARYNTETVLGQEVSYDDPGMKANNIPFALKSGN